MTVSDTRTWVRAPRPERRGFAHARAECDGRPLCRRRRIAHLRPPGKV